jgi:hypothetical protein
VGVYTKSKTSELSPLRRKLLRFAKQFPPPLRSNFFFFGALGQAVHQAVSKKRPKSPKLDIPFMMGTYKMQVMHKFVLVETYGVGVYFES